MSQPDVLVVVEGGGSRARRATLSAIAFARDAARATGGSVSLLVAGYRVTEAARELTRHATGQVLVCDDVRLDGMTAERCAPTIAGVGARYGLLVASATSFGKDVMPRVAARLDAGYAGDCRAVYGSEGHLVFERPMFAGNVFARCSFSTAVGVVTVRQSEFGPAGPGPAAAPIVEVAFVTPGAAASRVELVGFQPVTRDLPDLIEARVVVGGGRALRERFFELLEPLARELGAAIGATRAACDAGFAPGDFQVGQTGKVIAPELYIAVGLSGAVQHLAGMRGARVVVAINTAPDAPIVELSDYALIADLFAAVPELVQCLAARRAARRVDDDHGTDRPA